MIEAINNGADFYLQKGGNPKTQFAELSHIIRLAVERCRTTKALLESEEKYRNLFNNLTDAVYIHEIQPDLSPGRLLEVNDVMCSRLGYSREELLTMRIADIVPEEHSRNISAISVQMAATGSCTFYADHTRKDGSVIPVEVNSHVQALFGKTVALAVARDITERKRAEAAIRKSEEKYRTIIENLQDTYFRTDREGNLIMMSPSGVRTMGYRNEEEMLGRPAQEFYAAPEEYETIIGEILAEKSVSNREVRLKKADGCIITALFNSHIYTDAAGMILGTEGIIRDITDLKRAERDLRWSEARYRLISKYTADVIWTLDVTSGRFTYISPAVEKMWGFAPDEVLNQTMAGVLMPESFEKITGMIREKIAQRKPGDTERIVFTLPLDMRRKDGAVISTEVSATMVIDDPRHPAEIIGISRDITDRRRAEEALRESEKKYRNVVEDQTELISRFLPDGTHVFVNEAYCRYFGLDRDTIIGHRFRPDIPAKEQERVKQFFESLKPDHPVDIIAHQVIMPDGSLRWQRWSDRALFDSSGTATEYQSVGRDITEQKLAEEALRESEKKYRNLIENANEAIFVAQDGRLVLVNPRTTEMTGFGEEELLRIPYANIVHPSDRAMFLERYEKRMRGEYAPPRYAFRLNPKDNRLVWVEISAVIIDWDGRPATLNFLVDITERRRAEEALQESEENYRAIFETTGTATVIVENDATISLVNSEFERLSGYRKDELENKKKWTEFVVIEDLDRMLEQHRLRRTDRKSALTRYEFRFIARDGGIRDISLMIDLIPGTTKSVASLLDITERKRAEKELRAAYDQITAGSEELRLQYRRLAENEKKIRESEVKYRSLYDNLRDGSATVDVQGKITQCNPAFRAMLGYSVDELRNLTYEEITPARWHEQETRILKEQVDTRGYSDLYEKEYLHKDGRVIPVEMQTYLIRNRAGQRSGYWAIVRDITKRTR